MREQIEQQAKAALNQGDYALAAKNWIQGNCLPADEDELKEIFQHVNSLNEISTNADLCAILGYIALDYNDIFNTDRQEALIQCVQWSQSGLAIDADHYNCNRNAGSALYWLEDWMGAAKYYEKAIAVSPSPVLQIRLFNILNRKTDHPDYAALQIQPETTSAMEAYNAGVEINRLVDQDETMPATQRERLTLLKRHCYEHAYKLYRGAIVEENGDLLNQDPHTFAMCCTNLAGEARIQGEYERAIAIATEGMEYSCFLYILQTRFGAHIEADHIEETIADGERLIDEYAEQMDILTYFNTVDHICRAYMDLKRHQEALEWINVGLEVYYSLDPSDPITQEPEVVRCFTNFYIYKSNAETALGIEYTTEITSEDTDRLLEKMPDNPSLLISRANTFIEEGNFGKALECYQYAVHFAVEKGMERSIQVAFYNLGYLQVAHMHNTDDALASFEQSIAAGNQDFWCYYWVLHCAYHLTENDRTIYYGRLALQSLVDQEGIAGDIIAEIYEHMGTAQLDMEEYESAIENLEHALRYHDTKAARENLKIAQANKKSSTGFLRKLFGQ
jgi:tetratricopeptide (TPR) repeat protein